MSCPYGEFLQPFHIEWTRPISRVMESDDRRIYDGGKFDRTRKRKKNLE